MVKQPILVVLALIAVVGFAAFLIWELTAEDPIVDLRIFRHRGFTVAATTLVRAEMSSGTCVEIHRAPGGAGEKLGLCARTRALAQLDWTRVLGVEGLWNGVPMLKDRRAGVPPPLAPPARGQESLSMTRGGTKGGTKGFACPVFVPPKGDGGFDGLSPAQPTPTPTPAA